MHPLLKDHILPLRRYALALTRDADQSDDLVQETLARAIESAGSWDPRRDLRKWLFGIMHNTHASGRRRSVLEKSVADEITSISSDSAPASQFLSVHFNETIASLMRLPDEQREVMLLIAVEVLQLQGRGRDAGPARRHRDVAPCPCPRSVAGGAGERAGSFA